MEILGGGINLVFYFSFLLYTGCLHKLAFITYPPYSLNRAGPNYQIPLYNREGGYLSMKEIS